MKKMFNYLDNKFPLVRALQLFAVILFALSLLHLVPVLMQYLSAKTFTWELAYSAISHTGMVVMKAVYQPLVLLSIAEIIRMLRNNNAKNH